MKSSKSNDPFIEKLKELKTKKIITDRYFNILKSFYLCYKNAEAETTAHEKIFREFLPLVVHQFKEPFQFQPYHERIRKPYDYYQFGVEFIRPLVDIEDSYVLGKSNIDKMVEQLAAKENVILLANHQTETDPQAISLLLEDTYPQFAEEMIFVAGDRVVTDPLAIPFSMGRNLLCIFSKRYIDTPPELKEKKQIHNQKTMQLMSDLLKEGGKAIYVAPSGGRDRRNDQGEIELAPFDPQSIEMFLLMAKKSKRPTHFYPLSLLTYELLPPPKSVQQELGEERSTKHCPIHLAFGSEINMNEYPGSDSVEKSEKRKKRSEYIYHLVQQNYQKLLEIGGLS
ncbi:MAG: glycerol-3-phosphate acyltransferase [Chlamydiae bacterium CG10_big_fil_rev_8_21_14_0_10_35_9]|nr:MAG: glycerol-3-phosphate acyltransferase [Chlamydiae bacterium CG10_big_fil_rev_8_21_14_0_10_35_9]